MKNLLFVDDEPKVLQGLQRQLHLMRREWDMHFIAGGLEALEFMTRQPVDVVVTDMMMPGMDGSQLLDEVSRRHPNTVRIVLSGHAEREAILRLVGPAHRYLSKPCDPEDLRNTITRAFTLRDLLGNRRLKQLATHIKCLPSLPVLYQQLTELFQQDDPSLDRAAEIISRDIGMTTKILQLVNSAFFGLSQPVSNAREAVMYLGLSTLRSLVLTLQVFSQFENHPGRLFRMEALARHSWLTGASARRLAQLERQDAQMLDQCFLAGMLHDAGQLVLAVGMEAEYAEVLRAARDGHRPVWQAEQERFGASHADVGAFLLALWGLPDPIVEAVARHHHPALCPGRGFSPVLAVHAADVFQHERPGADTEFPPPGLDATHLGKLGFAGRIAAWRAACLESVEF